MFVAVPKKKCEPKMHGLSCREKCARGKSYVWSMVFSPTFFDPMVLVRGFVSKILNPGFGSLVLDLYGFGPWFEKGLDYKKGRKSFGLFTCVC